MVQNFAGRIALGVRKYNHISEGLKSIKWLSVSDKLFLYDFIMVHKGMNDWAPDYFSNKFTRRLEFHNRNTRYNKDLHLRRCRLKTGQQSFAYRGATCWNRLLKDLKEVANSGTFKKRIVNISLTQSWFIFISLIVNCCNFN